MNPVRLRNRKPNVLMKSILKLSLLGLLAIAVAGTPVALRAQDTTSTNKPAAKPARSNVFRGKLDALDNTAKTITVGSRTFQITSQTRIKKDGKPATLGDGVIGESVAGAYKKNSEGKLDAVSVNFGEKASKSSKAAAPEKSPAPESGTTTNTP